MINGVHRFVPAALVLPTLEVNQRRKNESVWYINYHCSGNFAQFHFRSNIVNYEFYYPLVSNLSLHSGLAGSVG